MATQRKKLVVIDGKSVFYRGYYAMPTLATKDGTPTGGVYGFVTMALEVIRRLKPDYVAVAWDKPKTNIRSRLAIYPEYKAGRKAAPPDFYAQIPILHEVLQAFGWPLYELDDYEADDILGALAEQAKAKDIETQLITSDLDALQLVNSHTHVYALKTGLSNIQEFDEAAFKEKYGIDVHQFIDLKSLKGDSSDNIPGVPGIGEKTALELLHLYKTLDGIYDNLALVKETVRKKLEAGKDMAYLSKKLVTLMTDAPVPLDLEAMDISKLDRKALADILQRLEFRSLLRQLPEVMREVQGGAGVPDFAIDASDGDAASSAKNAKGKNVLPGQELKIGSVHDITSAAELEKLTLPVTKVLIINAISAEHHGRSPVSLIFSAHPDTIYRVDLTKISFPAIAGKLKGYIEAAELIGYDVKASLQTLKTVGINARNVSHDVLIGAFLLDGLRREQSLAELALADLNYDGPLDNAAAYVGVIRGLYNLQAEEMSELTGIIKLAQDIEWPVIPVLADMEYEGIQLDVPILTKMSEEFDDLISDLQQQIYGFADQEFNIASPQQLAKILYENLGLASAGVKKGKTGSLSTAAAELEKLRYVHPIIELIMQYREVTKLKSTYVDTLPKLIDENSRIHTSYNLTIAQTGRLSSTDPNLQNIPVRTEAGKKIRTAFVAAPGKVFVSADYSQFELRLAAYLSGDTELMEMFNNHLDIHTQTAAQVYGRTPEEVTKNQRSDAKVINFGILYGMSPYGLSVATGMTREAAKDFIEKYSALRKPLFEYVNGLKEVAKKKGYVETLFGRRRPMPDIHASNFVVRQAAERAAMNMPIQGTEADLMKMAMIQVQNKLDPDCKQLLQVHDSILVECPEAKADAVAALLKDCMEHVHPLPVALDVDVSIGKNWGVL